MLQPLMLQPFPEYLDARRIREHAVSIMVKLTAHEDPVMQMHAAIWLFNYSKILDEEKKPKVKPQQSRAEILQELRATYARSLKPPLIVDVAPAVETAPAESPAAESAAVESENISANMPAETDDAPPFDL